MKAYDRDAPDHIALWLQAGLADCGIYSGLYYLIGRNCGLDTQVVNGTIQGISHAWNQIQLDGEWRHVDLAYGRFLLLQSGSRAIWLSHPMKKVMAN